MYALKDYSYELPEGLIAQKPAAEREKSRLLVLNRKTGNVSHHGFSELCDLLLPSDILVINNTEVIPARLLGKKDTGGKVEVLILDYAANNQDAGNRGDRSFKCMVRCSKPPKRDSSIYFDQGLSARVMDIRNDRFTLRFSCNGSFQETLYRVGKVPLPPYIKRNQTTETDIEDRSAYQTVYASQKGAIAAPTAGLHFSTDYLTRIKSGGIRVVEITLHVGYGTFSPVRVSDIRNHRMHSETYAINAKSAQTINRAKAKGCRIVAVGTTSVRTLEHAADSQGRICSGRGKCDLFIYPGYRFKVVDAMITNFHLPQSTLLMLVSAFADRQMILSAYETAIKANYRFYSYGDAMLIE